MRTKDLEKIHDVILKADGIAKYEKEWAVSVIKIELEYREKMKGAYIKRINALRRIKQMEKDNAQN